MLPEPNFHRKGETQNPAIDSSGNFYTTLILVSMRYNIQMETLGNS